MFASVRFANPRLRSDHRAALSSTTRRAVRPLLKDFPGDCMARQKARRLAA